MSNSSDDDSGPSWSTMGNSTCLSPNDPNAVWPYCPNEGAAILFAILFFATTCAHLFLAIKHRKGFCWVLIMGAAWECAAFGMRTAGTQFQQSLEIYSNMLILILLAPLWINAFVYMLFARVVYYFDKEQKVAFVPATRLGVIFICLDIVTFIVQAAGASMMSSTDASTINWGKTVYMSGIGFQEGFICLFLAFVVRFHLRARRSYLRRSTHYNPTVTIIYTSLALITMRIVFRLVEYSQGFDSPIVHTESYQYIFDALPMFVATVLWAIWHPGRVLVDRDGFFPTRAEKKQAKRDKKERRAREKADKADGKASFQLLASRDHSPQPGASPYLGATPGPPMPTPYDLSTARYYGAPLAEEGSEDRLHVPEYGIVV